VEISKEKPADKPCIIILALARWDGPYTSTTFSLAKEFSRTHKVFYIENPLTLKYVAQHFFTDEVKKRILPGFFSKNKYKRLDIDGDLTVVTPNVTLPVNFFPQGKLYDFFSGLNDKRIGKLLMQLLKDHHIDNYIFLNAFNPFYGKRLPSSCKPRLFIYLCVDNISHSYHIRKHGAYLEDEIVKKADLVFCTSKELVRSKSKHSSKVHLLSNAADVQSFKKGYTRSSGIPADISGTTRPIIIYVGNIDQRLDVDLLVYVVDHCKDYQFLMVGPVSEGHDNLDKLRSFPNIQFAGPKPSSELPGYLKQAACAIIPFKCNELTRSIYPLKVNEYLSVGRPVVSTTFSEDISDFSEIIHLATTKEEFTEGVKRYAESNEANDISKVNERIQFVENNNWENRAKQFWTIVQQEMRNHHV